MPAPDPRVHWAAKHQVPALGKETQCLKKEDINLLDAMTPHYTPSCSSLLSRGVPINIHFDSTFGFTNRISFLNKAYRSAGVTSLPKKPPFREKV